MPKKGLINSRDMWVVAATCVRARGLILSRNCTLERGAEARIGKSNWLGNRLESGRDSGGRMGHEPVCTSRTKSTERYTHGRRKFTGGSSRPHHGTTGTDPCPVLSQYKSRRCRISCRGTRLDPPGHTTAAGPAEMGTGPSPGPPWW